MPIKLSVIICTYNRAQFIEETLESVKNQVASKDSYEIIVIDNNCTDNTAELCRKFESSLVGYNYTYQLETQQGLPYARNRGIELAQGEVIAFMDDDGRADPEYVQNIINNFEKHTTIIAMGGKVLPIYPTTNEPVWMSKYVQGVVSKVDFGEHERLFPKKKYPVGCNMIFRKEVFTKYGNFDLELGRSDDKFMFYKLYDHNEKVMYTPNVIVHHHIDQFRIEKGFIIRISREVGSTERIRVQKNGVVAIISKFIEYLFKYCAAVVLTFVFILQGNFSKGKYLLLNRWNVLRGFLLSRV